MSISIEYGAVYDREVIRAVARFEQRHQIKLYFDYEQKHYVFMEEKR